MSSSTADMLARHDFVSGLPEGTVEVIAGHARPVTFEAGAFLLREGGVADTVYFVASGHVAIEVHTPGRERFVVETIGAGHVVGLSWAAPPFRCHFDARAIEDVGAVAVDAGALRSALASHPAIGYAFLERFSAVILERLQATRLRLLDLYGSAHAR